MKYIFPSDFLWGVATSAAQIEGAACEDGKGLSIWDVFSKIPGKIANGDTPEIACDHYHRFREDIRLIKSLNLNTYRFSFSWPRIFPEGIKRVNQKGLDFYDKLIDEMLENGIVPNATLYHWDLPYALEELGGWLNRDSAFWFADYAQLIFEKFGDRVPYFSTVNEPIAVYVGYAAGAFAPGKRLDKFGKQASHNLMLAHGRALAAFRALHLKKSSIGIVVDIWKRHPARKNNADDIALARLGDEESFLFYLNPLLKGYYSDYILEKMEKDGTMPYICREDMALIHGKLDFFGLNCYNRVVVSADENAVKREIMHNGGNFMDNNNEYYPRAVYDALHILKDEFHVDVPIFITENGTHFIDEKPDANGIVRDVNRIRYISGFLREIHRAIEDGIDVRGYYLWSLLDNFEWSAGYRYKFGNCHNDFVTQKRTCKDSARWYADVAANNGFADD